MSQEYEQEQSARQRRERYQTRKRQAALRLVCVICLCIATLLVLCVVLLRSCDQTPDVSASQPSATQLPQSTEPSAPKEGQSVITVVAGGDVNVTDQVVAAGMKDGRFDFSAMFMDIAPVFAGADVGIINLEGNLVGAPYGTESGSAPQELMEALERAGVDFVQVANSYALKNGILGLNTTIDRIRQAGMEPLGAFESQQAYEQSQGFTLKEINGIRVAFVAFTKGMGGLSLPSGSEDRVNLLYKDYATTYKQIDEAGIQATLQAVQAQQPDVTIALLHWGSEHKSIISDNQKKIKNLLLEAGVDAIIGTHSHYVQKVEYDAQAGTVVAYSLGDLVGDATATDTNYSILLQLQITKDHATGETKITACSYESVYTLTPGRDGEAIRLVRLDPAMAMYENNHVNKVSAKAYESMKSAKSKILSKTGM